MKRIKYILAAGLLLAGLAGAVYGHASAAPATARNCTDCCPPEGCFPVSRSPLADGPIDEPPPTRPGIAEGPTDDIPPTRPGVQASDPGLLAEGDVGTDGYDLKLGKKI